MSDVSVLIVDDQDPFRAAMAAVVDATDGFWVVGLARSGEESLAAAAELRPDLVLMDVKLPGMDGIEASRRLGATPGGPVVLLLSTYDADEFDLSDSCAAAYLDKLALSPDRLSATWSAASRDRPSGRVLHRDPQEQLLERDEE